MFSHVVTKNLLDGLLQDKGDNGHILSPFESSFVPDVEIYACLFYICAFPTTFNIYRISPNNETQQSPIFSIISKSNIYTGSGPR